MREEREKENDHKYNNPLQASFDWDRGCVYYIRCS